MDKKGGHDRHVDRDKRSPEATWGIAEAKQRFSAVVRAAEEEVQMIYNRDRRVAAVVGGTTLDAFLGWHERHRGRSLADAFAELRGLAAEDGFTFEAPVRSDRANPFAGDGGEEGGGEEDGR